MKLHLETSHLEPGQTTAVELFRGKLSKLL